MSPTVSGWAVFLWLTIGGQPTSTLLYVDDLQTCSQVNQELRRDLPADIEGLPFCTNLKTLLGTSTPYLYETAQSTEYYWFNPYWSGGGPLQVTPGVNHGWDKAREIYRMTQQ